MEPCFVSNEVSVSGAASGLAGGSCCTSAECTWCRINNLASGLSSHPGKISQRPKSLRSLLLVAQLAWQAQQHQFSRT